MADVAGGDTMHTERLLLRRWREADAVYLHDAFGDAETMRFWDASPSQDVAETAARIRRSREANPRWHAAYAAVLRQSGQIVGMVNYHERRPAHGRLAVGWILLPEWRGLGLAHEAAVALMRRCFTVLGTNRIEARIEPENAPSLALAERLGFRREGLMREWLIVDRRPRDIVLMAILRKDWNGF